MFRNSQAQSIEKVTFESSSFILGTKYERLLVFELCRNVPFGNGRGLIADVFLGDFLGVRLWNLKEIPKHRVVSHFQTRDACLLLLCLLQLSDVGLTVFAQVP